MSSKRSHTTTSYPAKGHLQSSVSVFSPLRIIAREFVLVGGTCFAGSIGRHKFQELSIDMETARISPGSWHKIPADRLGEH